jgi:hypothetical protein
MAIQKITADVISSDAITTASISDSAITAAKLAGTLDLTGKTITVATASSGDNDTTVASTAFVATAIANLADSAPSTLDTLNELAAALGDDANFSTTVTNNIATKLPLAGGTMTGSLLIDSSSSASISLDRGNDTSGSTVDFKTGGTLKWYMGLRGLSNDNFYLRNEAGSTDALTILTNGKVGIGETLPARELVVKNSSDHAIISALSGTSNIAGMVMGDTSDDDIGSVLYNNNGNYLYFTTNTQERMRIDSSGNVGIGTGNDTITGKLTVKDSSTLDINLIGNPPELNLEDTSSTSGTKRGRLTLDNNKLKLEGLADDDQSVTQSLFVADLSNGKVHIGGSNPEEKLDVEGAIKVGAAMQLGSNGTGQIGFNRNTFNGATYTSGLQRFQINGPISGSDYLHFQNYNSGGTYLDGLYINGGNVGVGEPSPQRKLHVDSGSTNVVARFESSDSIAAIEFKDNAGTAEVGCSGNSLVFFPAGSESARVSSGFTNTSASALPAFRTSGSYGGGIGMLDGVSQAGWYQQDNGDTCHHYVGKESSDSPSSKIVLTTRSNGHVGIMHGGSATINHPLHVTREEAGYQVKFDNDNGSAQGLAIRIKANDSGNFNAINTVSASSGSDKTVFNVRDDGIVTTPEQVYFLARRSGHLSGYNMSATSGATTTIFNSVLSAQSSAAGIAAFSTTDGTFSAPVDGLYLFHYSFYSNNTIEQAWFTSNGARIHYTDVSANTDGSYTSGVLSVSMQYYMSAGASIRVHPYSSGTNSATIYDNEYHTYWKGILIG